MFTGIIEEMGSVKSLRQAAGSARLAISAATVLGGTVLGDSICVNGVCLTVVDLAANGFSADGAAETLRVTNLGDLRTGDRVNLERALQLSARIGGHLVSGHVDAVGRIREKREERNGWRLFFDAPDAVIRYVIKKGSIAIDGISLTVADVDPGWVSYTLGTAAVAFATINVVGGFLVTHRMLHMFRKKS